MKLMVMLLMILLTLTGCNGNDRGEVVDTHPLAERIPGEPIVEPILSEDGTWQGEGGCYKIADTIWKDTVQGAVVYGEEVFTYSSSWIDEPHAVLKQGEEVFYEGKSFRAMFCGADGIWFLEDASDYKVDNRVFYMILVGYDKQEKVKKDVTTYVNGARIRGMCQDAQGLLYLLTYESIEIYSGEGEYQYSMPLDTPGSSIALGGDGNVYITTEKQESDSTAVLTAYANDSGEVWSVDTQTKSLERVGLYEGYRLCGGGEEYLFTLLNENGWYGIPAVGQDPEPIAIWAELGMVFDHPSRALLLSEGNFLLEDRNQFALIEAADPSQIKAKTILTMAAVSRYSTFTSLVSQFNSSNEDYMVKIVNYSKDGEISAQDAADQLNLDIISGNHPDLFDFLQLPQNYYADKGLLEDLYSYMEEDASVNPEDYIALSKLEMEGKLYSITDTFNLDTAAGLASRFGDSYGWSLDDYLGIQGKYSGEIVYNITRERFLEKMVYPYAAEAIDWEKGTCNFDNPEFIHLLECVSQIRENPEPENSADLDFTPVGRRLREERLIAASWYIATVTTMAEAETEAGTELSFIGWPTLDGSSGTQLYANHLVGICSRGNTEGAWEFVRFMLENSTEELPEWGLSTNRRVLEQQMEQAKEAYLQGESTIPFDDEYADRLYALIDHAAYYDTASDRVVAIIMEEAAPFLAGAKSAQSTAQVIQSRVGILVAE